MRIFLLFLCSLLISGSLWGHSAQSADQQQLKDDVKQQQPPRWSIPVLPIPLEPIQPPPPPRPKPQVRVDPGQGCANDEVMLTGGGFTPGDYRGSILWDNSKAASRPIPRGGTFEVKYTIPKKSPLGNHTITVADELGQRASVNFKVIRPLPPPKLGVNPGSGYAGALVTLEGSNYSPGRGSVLWNGSNVDTVPISRAGTFGKGFTIPS